MSGSIEINTLKSTMINKAGVVSFTKKYGKNDILSWLVLVPVGFDDPELCRSIKCTTTKATITMGTMKCRENIRFRVGWDTEKSPHNHINKISPTYGIEDSILVITVAPQYDICPHGSTYPINATIIDTRNTITPDAHTMGIFFGELK